MVKKTKAIKKQIRFEIFNTSEIFNTLNQIFLTGIILIVYVAVMTLILKKIVSGTITTYYEAIGIVTSILACIFILVGVLAWTWTEGD
jgi:flagellar biosynthesis protein FlhB